MTESDNSKRMEDKAVQALISAALHVDGEDVTVDEIRQYLCGEVELSVEDETALDRVMPSLVSEGSQSNLPIQSDVVGTEEFMALHRKQPGQGFSAKTEEEVKRKREELLAELRKKKKGSG
jgi:hypothetical protein